MRHRCGSGPGGDQDTIAWAALAGPTPRLASSCGAKVGDQVGEVALVIGERSVGVAAGEQQRAQAIDRPRLGCGEFPASAEQNA